MARAVGNEETSMPGYDTKLVWSYMVNGFVNSPFKRHFPHLLGASTVVLVDLPPALQAPAQTLDEVMASTLIRLRKPPKTSSPPMTPEGAPVSSPEPSIHEESLESELDVSDEPDESFDTVGENGHPEPAPAASRDPYLEPWAWANALLSTATSIAASARVRNPDSAASATDFGLSTADERAIGDEHWALALVPSISATTGAQSGEGLPRMPSSTRPESKTLHVFARGDSLLHARFSGAVVHAAFYGDDEVALVLARGQRRWLALVPIEGLRAAMVRAGDGGLPSFAGSPAHDLPLSRVRALGTVRCDPTWGLALNPAEGRRSGWVLTAGGEELCVLDLEVNEDEEWDEEEEEEGMEEE
jgi:hypothetical protein